MIKFRNLFSFSQTEIASVFSQIVSTRRVPGLKLMQAPLQINAQANARDLSHNSSHGKLLIVISRKTGKAHLRNLLRRRIKAIFYEKNLYEKEIYSILHVYSEATKFSFEQLQNYLVSWFSATNTNNHKPQGTNNRSVKP